MSQIVTTKLGRFRRVDLGAGKKAWLWECPRCQQWGQLSDEQWAGKVSVQCGDGTKFCGYHETHDFGAELVAVMQARILFGDSPTDPEESQTFQPSDDRSRPSSAEKL